MIAYTTLCALACYAAASGPFYGDIPKGVQTFTVTLSTGDQAIGALRVDGKWCDAETEIEGWKRVEIVIDEPWDKDRIASRRSLIQDIRAENQTFRDIRLKEGWGDKYVFIDMPGGEEMPVLKQELALADRARKMVETLGPQPAAEASPEGTAGAEAPEHGAAGLIRQWGGHVAVIVAGMALVAVVLKTMVVG